MKILLAEDERNLNKIITKRLQIEQYAVDCAYDGLEAWNYCQSASYDVLILDVMMPQMDGFTLAQRLRATGLNTPILFLTAKDSVQDKVRGLDLGGDDYLVKPFEFEELMARLRSLLRRSNEQSTNNLVLADLFMDIKKHKVTRAGQEVDLTAKEYKILEYLLHNVGNVLTREQIQEHVWDFSYEGASNMIDVYINSLRKKLDKNCNCKLLHTVRGVGYVLKD